MRIYAFKVAGIIVVCWAWLNLAEASQPTLRQVFHRNGVSQVLAEGESGVGCFLYASSNLVDWQRCYTNGGGYSSRQLLTFYTHEACSFYRAERIPVPVFFFAIAAKEGIALNGYDIYVDSFDSGNPYYSTNGHYDFINRRDRGDVAAMWALADSVYIASATILGHLLTATNAPIINMIGPRGSVGNVAWMLAMRRGIQPSWHTNDLKMDFWDVARPFTGGYMTPASGTNAGTYYDYILDCRESNGCPYALDSLITDGSVFVAGNAVLYIMAGELNCSAQSTITIATNSSLTIYMGGANAYFGGAVLSQAGNATNFCYFGLPENTNLVINANQFTGTVYAPSATLTLDSTNVFGGLAFVGACKVRSLRLSTRLSFHYDEALEREVLSSTNLVQPQMNTDKH